MFYSRLKVGRNCLIGRFVPAMFAKFLDILNSGTGEIYIRAPPLAVSRCRGWWERSREAEKLESNVSWFFSLLPSPDVAAQAISSPAGSIKNKTAGSPEGQSLCLDLTSTDCRRERCCGVGRCSLFAVDRAVSV